MGGEAVAESNSASNDNTQDEGKEAEAKNTEMADLQGSDSISGAKEAELRKNAV